MNVGEPISRIRAALHPIDVAREPGYAGRIGVCVRDAGLFVVLRKKTPRGVTWYSATVDHTWEPRGSRPLAPRWPRAAVALSKLALRAFTEIESILPYSARGNLLAAGIVRDATGQSSQVTFTLSEDGAAIIDIDEFQEPPPIAMGLALTRETHETASKIGPHNPLLGSWAAPPLRGNDVSVHRFLRAEVLSRPFYFNELGYEHARAVVRTRTATVVAVEGTSRVFLAEIMPDTIEELFSR